MAFGVFCHVYAVPVRLFKSRLPREGFFIPRKNGSASFPFLSLSCLRSDTLVNAHKGLRRGLSCGGCVFGNRKSTKEKKRKKETRNKKRELVEILCPTDISLCVVAEPESTAPAVGVSSRPFGAAAIRGCTQREANHTRAMCHLSLEPQSLLRFDMSQVLRSNDQLSVLFSLVFFYFQVLTLILTKGTVTGKNHFEAALIKNFFILTNAELALINTLIITTGLCGCPQIYRTFYHLPVHCF